MTGGKRPTLTWRPFWSMEFIMRYLKTWLARIPAFPQDSKIATRKAGSDVLQPVAEALPLVIGGSADLYGSTLNYIQ